MPFRVDRQDSHVQVPSMLATETEHLRTADNAGIPHPGDAVADLACTWRPVSSAGAVADVPWRTTPCLDPHLAREVNFKSIRNGRRGLRNVPECRSMEMPTDACVLSQACCCECGLKRPGQTSDGCTQTEQKLMTYLKVRSRQSRALGKPEALNAMVATNWHQFND